jgi:hypothetical protein
VPVHEKARAENLVASGDDDVIDAEFTPGQ